MGWRTHAENIHDHRWALGKRRADSEEMKGKRGNYGAITVLDFKWLQIHKAPFTVVSLELNTFKAASLLQVEFTFSKNANKTKQKKFKMLLNAMWMMASIIRADANLILNTTKMD